MARYTYNILDRDREMRLRWTAGKFCGWTPKQGLLNIRYAIFRRKSDDVLVPEYALTKESKAVIREIIERHEEV